MFRGILINNNPISGRKKCFLECRPIASLNVYITDPLIFIEWNEEINYSLEFNFSYKNKWFANNWIKITSCDCRRISFLSLSYVIKY